MCRERSLRYVSYPPVDDNEGTTDPITHFETCVKALFEYR
jgi:hypothetical protein